MTTTPPPATPAHALRGAVAWLAEEGPTFTDGQREYGSILSWLAERADELDAAPVTFELPAEPSAKITTLWSNFGTRWDRDQTMPGSWVSGRPGDRMSWRALLYATAWLSTSPPTAEESTDEH
jgi:hypothetical protein